MFHRIRYLGYGAGYWLRTAALGQQIPFIAGMVINDRCNLRCLQCRVASQTGTDFSWAQVLHGLKTLREMGIRSVFFEGGEPFLWRDGARRLDDVICAARQMGYLATSVYTNGTLPLETCADSVFVSLDGTREVNNALRGSVYDKVMRHIRRSTHPNLLINYTINARNESVIAQFLEEVAAEPHLHGVFFYFHTPYYGRDELFLDLRQRRAVVQHLLDLKAQGLPVLNSVSALKAAASDRWPRPSSHCYVFAGGDLFRCCRAIGRDEVCRECGYLGYTEITQILRLRPSAILAAMQYIPGRRQKH
jgi:MoaA/NifB/PqqE/SkfB family radical SAM enzyme